MGKYFDGDKSTEFVFQNDIIQQMLKNSWLLSDPHAANKERRTFVSLGLFLKEQRHELRDRGSYFSLCQFKPKNDLNPDALAYGRIAA